MSRQRSQPRTTGASRSTMRWISGSEQTARNCSAPASSASNGVAAPPAKAPSAIRWVTSFSTSSNTAAKSSVLSVNWWYSAPRVTPAARTISSVPTSANPRGAQRGRAAARSAARVAVERVACLLSIQTVCMLRTGCTQSYSRRETPMHQEIQLPQGTIRYRDSGGDGPVLVFVHGLLVDSQLWDGVLEELHGEFRCIAPDLPLGSHTIALNAGADRTPAGLANLIADLLAALDVDDVTLVANDTGGALSQILVTTRPERIGRLVLT